MVIISVIIVVIIMTIVIAAAFGLAVSKGYSVKHTVDPLPEDKQRFHDKEEREIERTESK